MTLIPVAVHGVPRSGTTWLGEILNSSPYVTYKFQPLFSYAFKGRLTERTKGADAEKFFEDLACTEDDFLDQTEKRKAGALPNPRKSSATHVIYKEVRYHNILENLVTCAPPRFRLILLVRNPLSVIGSWLNAPREFRSDLGWDALQEWRCAPRKNLARPEEFNGFEKWKEATRLFLQLAHDNPQRVMLITYEELVRVPIETTRKLFKFCELPLSVEITDFLAASSSIAVDDSYAVYRNAGSLRQWEKELHPDIQTAIKSELQGTDLECFLKRLN